MWYFEKTDACVKLCDHSNTSKFKEISLMYQIRWFSLKKVEMCAYVYGDSE